MAEKIAVGVSKDMFKTMDRLLQYNMEYKDGLVIQYKADDKGNKTNDIAITYQSPEAAVDSIMKHSYKGTNESKNEYEQLESDIKIMSKKIPMGQKEAFKYFTQKIYPLYKKPCKYRKEEKIAINDAIGALHDALAKDDMDAKEAQKEVETIVTTSAKLVSEYEGVLQYLKEKVKAVRSLKNFKQTGHGGFDEELKEKSDFSQAKKVDIKQGDSLKKDIKQAIEDKTVVVFEFLKKDGSKEKKEVMPIRIQKNKDDEDTLIGIDISKNESRPYRLPGIQ